MLAIFEMRKFPKESINSRLKHTKVGFKFGSHENFISIRDNVKELNPSIILFVTFKEPSFKNFQIFNLFIVYSAPFVLISKFVHRPPILSLWLILLQVLGRGTSTQCFHLLILWWANSKLVLKPFKWECCATTAGITWNLISTNTKPRRNCKKLSTMFLTQEEILLLVLQSGKKEIIMILVFYLMMLL